MCLWPDAVCGAADVAGCSVGSKPGGVYQALSMQGCMSQRSPQHDLGSATARFGPKQSHTRQHLVNLLIGRLEANCQHADEQQNALNALQVSSIKAEAV